MASEKVTVITKNNFEQEVINSELPVMIDFWATWCGPCRMVAPIMDELAEEYEGKAKICKINVDDEGELAAKFRVMSIPTIMVYKNGNMAERIVGAMPKNEFKNILDKHL